MPCPTICAILWADGYQVTLTLDLEKSVAIPLTPRYTTPDGGTFTLDGEEGPQ